MDGLIIINKEKGISSFGVVAKLRKILNIKKIGHTGTLDPNATGVLPVLIGKGTKISKYLIEHDKTYEATLFLGKATSTGDEEGEVIEEKVVDKNILKNTQQIELILKSFLGKSNQKPPIYSAIKKNGKKLYEYAREGIEVEIPEREIEIYEIKLEKIELEKNLIHFTVKCSKGTYIRTLCEDIAKKLETCGYMKDLKRLEVDEFKIEDAITLNELEMLSEEGKTETCIQTIEEIFKKYPSVNLSSRKKELFLNGVKLTFNLADGLYKIYNEEEFIGIGIIENELLKREVVVNY